MRNKIDLDHKMGQDADIYHKYASTYEIFSRAEDYPEYVGCYLKNELKNKSILDVGCGTGKYLPVLAPGATTFFGVDCSEEQLKIAADKSRTYDNCALLQNYAENISLSSKSVDAVMATWVLESVREQKKQNQILSEMERILKRPGLIYVVENTGDSEFDSIIKREPDISTTKQTRDWLLARGFDNVVNFESYFLFSSIDEARFVFSTIWGDVISDRIQNRRIGHNISVYKKVVI